MDTAAARLLWASRADEAVRDARAAGWRYLLVDLGGLPPLGRPSVDGWLAERAGMPVARDASRLLYDLSAAPEHARPLPPVTVDGAASGQPGGAPPR